MGLQMLPRIPLFIAQCVLGEGTEPDSPPSQEWPWKSVPYRVRGPSQRELQPSLGGPGTLGLGFANPQEAQRWAAQVRGAMEGQNENGQCPGAKIHLVGQGLC